MKIFLSIIFLFQLTLSQAQNQEQRIKQLEIHLGDLHKRTHKFAKLNNAAGMLYFGGLIVAAATLSSENPDKEFYYAAGGMALTGTLILYFSGNALKSGNPGERSIARKYYDRTLDKNKSGPWYRR